MRFLARVEDTDKILLKDKSKISSEPVRFYRGIQDHLEEASENNFQWLIDDVKKGFMELINDSLKSTTNSQLKKILSTNINQLVGKTICFDWLENVHIYLLPKSTENKEN